MVKVLADLSTLPPLVFAGEIRSLKQLLGKAVTGDAFLLGEEDEYVMRYNVLDASPLLEFQSEENT